MKCNDKKIPNSPPKRKNRKGIIAMLILGPLNIIVDITIRKIENIQPKIPEITLNTSLTDPKLISTISFVMSKDMQHARFKNTDFLRYIPKETEKSFLPKLFFW